MYHSFDEMIFSLSKRVALCSKFVFLDPFPMNGPIKSRFCLFVSPSAVRHFSQEWIVSFFQIFCTMLDNWNSYKMSEPLFPGKFIFPLIWAKIAQNDPKISFFGFFEKFCD